MLEFLDVESAIKKRKRRSRRARGGVMLDSDSSPASSGDETPLPTRGERSDGELVPQAHGEGDIFYDSNESAPPK